MNLQYISDSDGQTTGVFIPIKEWNNLKKKYKGIEEAEGIIPQWHKDLVKERLENYNNNPGSALDFDKSMDDIENGL
jgi:hypothetical protein